MMIAHAYIVYTYILANTWPKCQEMSGKVVQLVLGMCDPSKFPGSRWCQVDRSIAGKPIDHFNLTRAEHDVLHELEDQKALKNSSTESSQLRHRFIPQNISEWDIDLMIWAFRGAPAIYKTILLLWTSQEPPKIKRATSTASSVSSKKASTSTNWFIRIPIADDMSMPIQ